METKEWYKILNDLTDPVSIHDKDFTLIKVNQAMANLLQVRPEELVGKKCYKVMHGVDCPIADCPHARTLETGQSNTEKLFEPRLGADLEISTSPILDNKGNVVASVHILKEIAQPKLVEGVTPQNVIHANLHLDGNASSAVTIYEQSLANILDIKSLQSLMDNLYAVSPIHFALIDLKGRVLVGTGWQQICTHFHRVNPQTLNNCLESNTIVSRGLKKGEIREYKCKNNLWNFVTPLYIGDRHIGNIYSGQFFYEDETIDYDFFAAQADKYGFDKPAYLAAVQRIPRWSRAKIQSLMLFYCQLAEIIANLSNSNLNLAAANRELEAFSYSASHDLRQPLRAMDGFSQAIIEDYADKLDETGKDYLKRIRQASQHMSQIIDDIINLSKVTRVQMQYEEVNLTMVAKSIAKDLIANEPTRQIEFTIAEGLLVKGDLRLLTSALENLFGNSVKFTSQQPQAKIEFGVIQKEKEIYFIRDNGAGFDMRYNDKLFKPFQRLHINKEYSGDGIGLAIVQRIIRRHGGRIWAASRPGEGATFFFTLN